MKNQFEGIEPMVYQSKISVPYSWWAGETATHFLHTIKDSGEILGRKCGKCSRTYVPPRKVCPECFSEMEWVPVSNEGKLVSYTIVRRKLASLPKDPPVVYGLIQLDGSDTALLHLLDEVDPGKLAIGMRFRACFSDERKGTIRDIKYFAPVS